MLLRAYYWHFGNFFADSSQVAPLLLYGDSTRIPVDEETMKETREDLLKLSENFGSMSSRYSWKGNESPQQGSKTLESPNNFEELKKLKTGKHLNMCSVCNKTFKTLSKLKNHRTIHSEERPYVCSVCNKAYRLKKSLKRHEVIHGNPCYRCSFCNKGFTFISDLKRHKKIHTGERPYACLICHKTFKHILALKAHGRIH